MASPTLEAAIGGDLEEMPLGRAALDFHVQPKGSTVQGCRAWPADATELATILCLARAAWGRGGLSKAYGADGRYRAQTPCPCRFHTR
jgi:hypothetical protein